MGRTLTSSPFLLPALVGLAALVLAAVLLGRRPRYVRRALLSPAEKRFYRALLEAAGPRGVVVTKVRIADLLAVRARKRVYWKAFHKIAQKHVDFVVLDPQSLEPVCAIELDDSSHERRDRKARDRFVDSALAGAGLPLYRFPVRRQYDRAEIARVIGSWTARAPKVSSEGSG